MNTYYVAATALGEDTSKLLGPYSKDTADAIAAGISALGFRTMIMVREFQQRPDLPLQDVELICRTLMIADRKIFAIKVWRWHMQCGLHEAKEAVEALALP